MRKSGSRRGAVFVDQSAEAIFLVGHGVGVQIYSCNATAAGFAWTFVAPRADLFNDEGMLIITLRRSDLAGE